MVISDLKSNLRKERSNQSASADSDGDDDLYNLVRGLKSTMMIQKGNGRDDYVPKRRVIMVVSSNSEDENYTPKKPEEKLEIDNKNRTN